MVSETGIPISRRVKAADRDNSHRSLTLKRGSRQAEIVGGPGTGGHVTSALRGPIAGSATVRAASPYRATTRDMSANIINIIV